MVNSIFVIHGLFYAYPTTQEREEVSPHQPTGHDPATFEHQQMTPFTRHDTVHEQGNSQLTLVCVSVVGQRLI